MPYKKSYRKRKYKKRGKKRMSLPRKNYALVKRLYRQIETKYVDAIGVATGITSAGNLTNLSLGVTQGLLDIGNRIGDKITVTSLIVRFYLVNNAMNGQFRIIFFWDKQNKVTTPGGFLSNVGSPQSILSPKDYDRRFDSKTLKDVIMKADFAGRQISHMKFRIPINKQTQYIAGGTGVNTGALKWLLITDNALGLGDLHYFIRMKYVDL